MKLFAMPAFLVSALMLFDLGTGRADADDEMAIVDSVGRTITVTQRDTFVNGVSPLDRNRLTREWFHNGRLSYSVSGPGAESFEGRMELGYQVDFPWTLGVVLNFSYASPNLGFWGETFPNEEMYYDIYTTPFFPGGSIAVDLNNGNGPQEVVVASAAIRGPSASIAVSNAHGTVTGAAGGVTIRPFARVVAENGDIVTTYGDIWNMN